MAKAIIIIGLLLASYFWPEGQNLKVKNLELQLTQKNKIEAEIISWEEIVTKKPNYRDGWLNLAFLYRQISDNEKAQEAILKAKTLDPGYPSGPAFLLP